jgi:hypothetical protein
LPLTVSKRRVDGSCFFSIVPWSPSFGLPSPTIAMSPARNSEPSGKHFAEPGTIMRAPIAGRVPELCSLNGR